MPVKDIVENYELLNGYQNDTHTVFMFTRLWNTCDKQHDIAIGVSSAPLRAENKYNDEISSFFLL